MTLVNAEYFTFDGVDIRKALEDKGFLFIVNNTKGRGILGQDTQTFSVSGIDGTRLLDVTIPEREIEVQYTLVADNLVKLREAESYLASLLVRETVKPLSFVDQEGGYEAILTGYETNLETDTVQQGSITFLCPNPFRYKDTVEIKNMQFSANVPQTITVDANYYTEAVIRVNVLTPTNDIQLTVNDSVIRYKADSNIIQGQVVVFDGEAQECRQAGILKVLEVSGDFPLLQSNLNTITINTPALLTIKYRERDL